MKTTMPTEIYFEREALLGAPNAQYFLRLMLAINDLASAQMLMGILDEQGKQLNQDFVEGMHLYLMRTETGHLVEATDALFVNARTSPLSDAAHPLYALLQKDAELTLQFKEIEKLVRDEAGTQPTNKELYSQLDQIRNNIAFHYNDKPPHKVTERALAGTLELLRENKIEKVKAIVFGKTPNIIRFPIADRATDVALSQIVRDQQAGSQLTEKIRQHRTALARAIVDFGQKALIGWLEENKLKPTTTPH